MIASGSDDKTIKLWDITSRKCEDTFIGHSKEINRVQFSPNGKWLTSCSEDKTIRIWDNNLRKCAKTFHAHKERIITVQFAPNGNKLFCGSYNYLKIWNLKTGKLLKSKEGNFE